MTVPARHRARHVGDQQAMASVPMLTGEIPISTLPETWHC